MGQGIITTQSKLNHTLCREVILGEVPVVWEIEVAAVLGRRK